MHYLIQKIVIICFCFKIVMGLIHYKSNGAGQRCWIPAGLSQYEKYLNSLSRHGETNETSLACLVISFSFTVNYCCEP